MHTSSTAILQRLKSRARHIRLNVLYQGMSFGQGYVGQGMQTADLMAVLHCHEMNWSPERLDDPARDRFLLSTGHYGISLYATYAAMGMLSREQLESYGQDGSLLTLGAEAGHLPGIEFTGGSLGQGLGVAAGLAWGLKQQGNTARVFNYMSDGETQEGSVWEAAMLAGSRGIANLVNIVDVNRVQADGPLVLEIEPLAEKFRAFGWWVEEVDGNDMDALLEVFEKARSVTDKPKTLVCHTQIGAGSPTLESYPKAHFVRVEPDQWQSIYDEFEAVSASQLEEAAQ